MRKPILLLAVLLLGIGGCSAGKEYTYEPSSETPPGPGLFSGKDGVFTIYGKESSKNSDEQPAKTLEYKAEQAQ